MHSSMRAEQVLKRKHVARKHGAKTRGRDSGEDSNSDASADMSISLAGVECVSSSKCPRKRFLPPSSADAAASRANGKAPISDSSNARHDDDPFIVKCVLNRKTWPGKLPTFIQIAKVALFQQRE